MVATWTRLESPFFDPTESVTMKITETQPVDADVIALYFFLFHCQFARQVGIDTCIILLKRSGTTADT